MRLLLLTALLLIAWLAPAQAQGGAPKKRPRPYLYGSVTMAATSSGAGVAAVAFDHWDHRNRFTCRLCHVDLNFAMTAGATQIRAADNARGEFCGACHDGKRRFTGQPLFAACREGEPPIAASCVRCHTAAATPERERRFLAFSSALPRERFGNGIDWETAEVEGKIHLIDLLEGVSVKRKPLGVREDFDLNANLGGMPEIIFSHRKHTAWSGCELCHPEIFLGVKKGTSKYSMVDLFAGRYCGACHDKVAFPQSDCQRCHAQPVQ